MSLPPPAVGGPYAPLSQGYGSHIASGCDQVLQILDATFLHSNVDPYWGARFWNQIGVMESQGQIPDYVGSILRMYGYSGGQTAVAPRMPELRDALTYAGSQSHPVHGAVAPGSAGTESSLRFNTGLAPDFRRAAFDTYRNMMGDGASSVREWVTQNYQGPRGANSSVWIDLWTNATQIDYRLAEAERAHPGGGVAALHSDDNLELGLRRIASWIYIARTGDTDGGNSMLAVVPPGTLRDIGPRWLVDEASAHTTKEHKRAEAVHATARRRKGDGKKGDGKTDGKKGDGKKGSAKGGADAGK